ncbi:hypothetical protein FRB94_012020 [Tulasnella sp. JGI-2019a]|nr:hypothetical protein FRB94_012020 [Tulasnella sp. JGI-2019a]KAG9022332.1 hypothetical protein FRB95_000345 [Tulasnella sp. JGI-2019a]
MHNKQQLSQKLQSICHRSITVTDTPDHFTVWGPFDIKREGLWNGVWSDLSIVQGERADEIRKEINLRSDEGAGGKRARAADDDVIEWPAGSKLPKTSKEQDIAAAHESPLPRSVDPLA